MFSKKTIPVLITALFLTASCSYDFPEANEMEEVINSPADFSSFYVIGDTYASGYMDGALYNGGQQFSYANIVGNKLEDVLEVEQVFTQATVEDEFGFNQIATQEAGEVQGKFSLLFRSGDSIYPARNASQGQRIEPWDGAVDTLRDFSFPNLKSYEAVDEQRFAANSYVERLNLRNLDPVAQITQHSPGLVLVSLGHDDILEYALAGASGNENPSTTEMAANDLTPAALFESSLKSVVNRLLSESEAEIFIANIFNLLDAPYFKSLSHALETEQYSAGYINTAGSDYAAFNNNVFQYNEIENGGVPPSRQRPIIVFDAPIRDYPVINAEIRARAIVDEYLPEAVLNDGTVIPKWRQLTEEERVLYKTEGMLNESSPLSAQVPLSDDQALTAPEIAIIMQRIEAFNDAIESLAEGNDRIHLIDVRSVIEAIKNEEVTFNGVRPSLEFERRGIFSSDGYTLNPRGNAIIANQLIKTINQKFNGTLQQVNPNDYRGDKIYRRYRVIVKVIL